MKNLKLTILLSALLIGSAASAQAGAQAVSSVKSTMREMGDQMVILANGLLRDKATSIQDLQAASVKLADLVDQAASKAPKEVIASDGAVKSETAQQFEQYKVMIESLSLE